MTTLDLQAPRPMAQTAATPHPTPRPATGYRFAGMLIDPVSRSLTAGGQPIPLSARLFDTLLFLVEHHDQLVDRDALMQAVWGGPHVDDATVSRTVSTLRATLRQHGAPKTLITPAPPRGYRLGAAVEKLTPPQAAPAAPQPRFWRAGVLAACAAAALAAATLVMQRATRQDQAAFRPPPHSLAVLPFASSPGDAAAADLSDGLAEQLISELGRVGQLHIVAPQSALMFRNTTSPLLEIAKRLDVGAILAGSIRRFGGTLHITIQLSDPRTGFAIWSGAYDRPGDDVPALRDDIARHVTQALGLVAPQAPDGIAATGGSRNPAAWDALFAAVPLIGTGKMQEYQQARSLLTKAITLDPTFAEAYRYRATVEVAMEDVAASAIGENQDDFIRAAITDGQTAVALAPQSGPAHGALAAALHSSDRNPRGAATEYQRALLLSPSDGELYARAAQVMLELGMRDIAVAYARRGEALDPLSALTVGNAASVFAHAHLADDTHAALRHLHELAPNTGWTNDRTCVSLMVLGEFAGAQAVCDQEPAWVKASTDAIGYWKRGDKAKAASALRDLQALGRDDFAIQFAEIYTTWGDLKNGRYWLSEATRLHDTGLPTLLVDVFLAPLRDTPEFDAAARSVGLR